MFAIGDMVRVRGRDGTAVLLPGLAPVAMQEGRLNGQEAFMTGKMKIEGDLAFLMQIAALNA